MHQSMAATLDMVIAEIKEIQRLARSGESLGRPQWPMIVLVSPKGWTGPKEVDGKKVEDFWRSHQVPLAELATKPDHLKALEEWLKSYRPEELFDETGRLREEFAALAPKGDQRMGANPHANGGSLLRDLRLPDYRNYAVEIPVPGTVVVESARILGDFLRDVMRENMESRNFRVFGPDETASNRLQALFEVTGRTFEAKILPYDEHLAIDGRVMEVLSEHMCQGWLEGYLLTGRHGFFERLCADLGVLGVTVDAALNKHAVGLSLGDVRRISPGDADVEVFVVATDENAFIAQEVQGQALR